MKRYRLTLELERTPDNGMAIPGDVMQRLVRVAPWSMGAFSALTLAWWSGHAGPFTPSELLAAANKTGDLESLEQQLQELAALGFVEISYLS